jgi:hypothetical protein
MARFEISHWPRYRSGPDFLATRMVEPMDTRPSTHIHEVARNGLGRLRIQFGPPSRRPVGLSVCNRGGPIIAWTVGPDAARYAHRCTRREPRTPGLSEGIRDVSHTENSQVQGNKRSQRTNQDFILPETIRRQLVQLLQRVARIEAAEHGLIRVDSTMKDQFHLSWWLCAVSGNKVSDR